MRTNWSEGIPSEIWKTYIQLTQAEDAFRKLAWYSDALTVVIWAEPGPAVDKVEAVKGNVLSILSVVCNRKRKGGLPDVALYLK